jgi:hypothetical protein
MKIIHIIFPTSDRMQSTLPIHLIYLMTLYEQQ